MNNQRLYYESGFKCDVSLFLEGVNNANLAKSSVRSNILTANTMLDIEGMGEVIECLNKCNIELLVSKIEECKNSLLKFDNDFADKYFRNLSSLRMSLDKESLDEDYLTQFNIYEKEYWNILANMLEKNEDQLTDEMKKQLEIAKAMAGFYNVTDEMGSSNNDSEKLIDLLKEKKKYEEELLKLNGNLKDEEIKQELAKIEEKYNIAILGVKCEAVQKRMSELDINAEDYEKQCLDLLKKQEDYQKQIIMSSKDLTEEEIQENLALIDEEYNKNIILVKNSVLINEYGKLDITDDNYLERSFELLSKQRNYSKQLLRLDKSLTEEQLNEQLSALDLQYEYSFLMTEVNKIQSDIDNLDIEANDYEKTRLELFTEQRSCAEKMLRMNKDLTEGQINEQLSYIDQAIRQSEQNIEWDEMSIFEKGLQYTRAFFASTVFGLVDVGESIYDGMAMLTGFLLGDQEAYAELVKADFSEAAYSWWANNTGINDNAAYSLAHDAGNMLGNVVGYAALSLVPGGAYVTGTLALLAALGSASERALNNGATFNQAFWIGMGSGALGLVSGVWSNNFTSSLKNKVYDSLWGVGLDALKGGTIGTIEPMLNSVLEYSVYAKDLKDENGELLYKNDFDYYAKSGTFINMLTGAGAGFSSTAINGLVAYNKSNKPAMPTKAQLKETETEVYKQGDSLGGDLDDSATKSQVNEFMDSLTPEQRTNAWNEYYSGKYGADYKGSFSGDGLDTSTTKFPEIGTEVTNYGGQDGYTAIAKGESYAKLDEICKKYGMTRDEFLALTRTHQHNIPTIEQKKAVFNICRELSADVTDAAGAIKSGTSISKSISAEDFNKYYGEGSAATLRGCVALSRDVDALGGNAEEIINATGLKYDGSKFINANGEPNDFYIVEAKLQQDQPAVGVRISATTDATEISPSVASEFKNKHPDYKYNGYDIDDISKNDTYLNEIWTRKGEAQRTELSALSGVPKERIVVEEARFYNKPTNPDVGNGFTLNQGNSKAFGLPEFYVYNGKAVKVYDGAIYKISGGQKIKVAIIDIAGQIHFI